MTRHAIQPEGLPPPKAPLSRVVVSNELVFVSGQSPFDRAGRLVSDNFREQAHAVFDNVGQCLAAVDCTFDDVVKVNAFLSDRSNFEEFNEIYREYFDPPFPARTTIEAGLVGILVEVEVIARLKVEDGGPG